MRMTVDNDITGVSSCQFLRGRAADFVAMTDMNSHASNISIDTFGQTRHPRRVGITEYSPHWCDETQLVENVRTTDITSMENDFDPFEHVVDGWSNQAVGVGNQSDEVRRGRRHSFYILGG